MRKDGNLHRYWARCAKAGGLALTLLVWGRLAAQDGSVITLGSRRELFVDRYLLDTTSGVELRLHQPTSQEVVMHYDRPWEGNACGFHTIFRDGHIYRMYYGAGNYGPIKKLQTHEQFICYAESKDGRHWVRPELGLFEFNGSKKNNIVWTTPNLDNFSCFRDTNPAATGESPYKGFHNVALPKGAGLMAIKSTDGIHWTHLADQPVLTDGAFDSLNLAFWDAETHQYRAYYRDFRDGRRDIKTATSQDFIHWTPGVWLEYPGAEPVQLYINDVIPYYRAPQIYVGFPEQYIDRGWSDSMRALPGLTEREVRARVNQRYGTAITDGLFMTSRDGMVFNRWAEAFLRPGLGDNWVYGDNYQNWGIIETEADSPDLPNEISIYATQHYWVGTASELRRHTLRVDGFVSVNAPGKGGEFTTRPLTFTGKKLEMNYSTSVAGSVRVEIQEAGGTPLSGYALDDCPEIFGDRLDQIVKWKGGSDVSSLAGRPIRLRFVMKDADLYSIRFRP
jgi:hypothetical protein